MRINERLALLVEHDGGFGDERSGFIQDARGMVYISECLALLIERDGGFGDGSSRFIQGARSGRGVRPRTVSCRGWETVIE